MKVKKYRGQNYWKLKKNLVKRLILFNDNEFPALERSLEYEKFKYFDVEWKRPSDLCDNPTFTIGVPNGKVMVQGSLGNCWFVAACAVMTQHKCLWTRVIPDAKQGWSQKTDKSKFIYTGLFRFRFWRFGEWSEVVVDDLLPTRRGQLIFTKSKNDNEFWCSLLEKAYAKFYGCYDVLTGGNLADALLDISGGVPETINLKKTPAKTEQERKQLFSTLRKAFESKAMIMAAIEATDKTEIDKIVKVGLLKSHAYAISAVKKLKLDAVSKNAKLWDVVRTLFKEKDRVDMIRLRDPWGKNSWKGPWSEGSSEWQSVSDAQKKQLGLTLNEENGEFWMSFEDFCDVFTMITICYDVQSNRLRFNREFRFFDDWSRGSGELSSRRCGGSVNEKETFLFNHQYMLKLYDSTVSSKSNDLIISLLQTDKRSSNITADYFSIGITLIRVEENRMCRIHSLRNLEVVAMSDFVNARSTCLRKANLASGRYIIIPSTFRPNQETSYLLRVYSPRSAAIKRLNDDTPNVRSCISCISRSKPLTNTLRIKVVKATDLLWTDLSGYFISLKSEDKIYRSQTVRNSDEPFFGWSVVLYRRFEQSSLEIQLWSAGKCRKKLLGSANLETTFDENLWQYQISVTDSNKRIVGKVTMIVVASKNVENL